MLLDEVNVPVQELGGQRGEGLIFRRIKDMVHVLNKAQAPKSYLLPLIILDYKYDTSTL